MGFDVINITCFGHNLLYQKIKSLLSEPEVFNPWRKKNIFGYSNRTRRDLSGLNGFNEKPD